MDNKKKIEIPFGAFDSELIRQEINIPNGFNAVINGNKIILTRVESENERIRKEIITYLQWRANAELSKQNNFNNWLAWLEKQGEQIDIANKEYWRGYREGKQEVLDKYTELEKQSEQKSAEKVEPKFRVKYAGSEYNVLEIKEIAGDTYYGIEDEPNHIDYVLPDNCEIVSEQKSTWSEGDERMFDYALDMIEWYSGKNEDKSRLVSDWLKSLKDRYTWKPSDEQMTDLWNMLCECRPADHQLLQDIYYGLKKLTEE